MVVVADINEEAIEVGSHRELCPAHLKQCTDRGVSKEFAELAGLYTEHDTKKLANITNRKTWRSAWRSAVVFPYHDLDGRYIFSRVKADNPPVWGGKPHKYMQPKGAGSRAYFPPGVPKRLANGATEVLLTEGEYKALCLAERGYCCIGLAGVWNWKPGKKVGKLLPELEQVEWHGRKVYIVFDSDSVTKQSVMAAEQVLAAELQARGAIVRCIRLPATDDGDKQGVDDFIVAQGDDWTPAFVKLLNEAIEPDEVDPGSIAMAASDMDPATEAADLVQGMVQDTVCKLRFFNGGFWNYSRGCYSLRRDDEVRAELVNRLNDRYTGVRPKHATDVLEHLKAKTILSSSVDPPAWLGGDGTDPPPAECVVLRNGLLHLPTLFADTDKDCLTPATPRLFTTSAVDYSFDIEAPEPTAFFAFLDSVWPDDQESIDALQEVLGYLLTTDTSHQKIFLLIGPTRSGKGTLARLIRLLVGAANVCGPTLASLAGNFGLAPLLGKSVAMISDARLGHRTDQSIVLERLLSISGEDALSIPVKFKEDVTTKLTTRLVILSNELPRLSDASSAITGRFLVLRMTQSFLGREDRNLDAKLAAELPSIFLWACEGWRRLNERGYFEQPGSGIEMLADLRDLASPVTAFVRDRCEVGPGFTVPINELFHEWTCWCKSQGRDHTGTVQTFGRDLLAAVPGVSSHQPRINGVKVRVYEGIRLPHCY